MLSVFKPDFPDVQMSTPTPEEYASCSLEWVPGTRQGSGSYVLRDAKKQLLRRYSITGGTTFDTWSYYKDGVEVFREIDSDFDRRKDQYRWLGTGGMKWGVSTRQDCKIDFWKYISAEEAAQELFTALSTGDAARLEALLITPAEIKKLPTDEARRIDGLVKGASSKFQATRAKQPHLDKAHFVRVESAAPNCVPADTNGTDHDQLRFPFRTILFESADKQKPHDWVQTGEMIKIDMAWRFVDGPSAPDSGPTSATGTDNVVLRQLFDALTALDDPKTAPAPLAQPANDAAVQRYNTQRVAIIEKIAEQVKGNEQETWIKQIFDNLSAAYQAGHAPSLAKLAEKRDQIAKALPNSNLAAYGAYRYLWASYAAKITGKDAVKHQDEWLNQLASFAQAYPKSDDTPDALWQLAMGSEFSGKDEESKGWYRRIYQDFPSHALAAKARGSEKRLNSIGQPLELVGPELGATPPRVFNIASLKNKVVVVYYWSSGVQQCERDFTTLKRLRAEHTKDLELVCVNLDDNPGIAHQYVTKAQLPGIHLYEAGPAGGGLESPLAISYGINGLPHVFLVGKDGKVVDRTLQVGDLEKELKRAL
jgi:hypothetical protein